MAREEVGPRERRLARVFPREQRESRVRKRVPCSVCVSCEIERTETSNDLFLFESWLIRHKFIVSMHKLLEIVL